MSGGGVGGTMRSDGGMRTAATSPTKAVPRLLVQVADVVGGVAGGVGDPHSADAARRPARGFTFCRGDRQDLAPQVLHLVAVEALGAGQELRGVDQVRGAALVDVDLEVGPAAHQRAGRRGVVEVDVGEQERPRPLPAERLQQGADRGLGPGIDQNPSTSQHPITCGRPRCIDVDHAHRAAPMLRRLGPAGQPAFGLESFAQALLEAARLVAELTARLLVARPEGDAVGGGDQLAQVGRLAHHLADQRPDRDHRLHHRGRDRVLGRLLAASRRRLRRSPRAPSSPGR